MAKQPKAKFQAELLLAGKTATGIEIPPEVVESLGAGKKPPVAVTINGHTYRSTVASRSGRFLVGVSAENRAAADVAAGDKIEVELELDDKPREVTVPDDLAAALDRDAKARASSKSSATARSSGTCFRSRRPRSRRPGSDGWTRRSRCCVKAESADRAGNHLEHDPLAFAAARRPAIAGRVCAQDQMAKQRGETGGGSGGEARRIASGRASTRA